MQYLDLPPPPHTHTLNCHSCFKITLYNVTDFVVHKLIYLSRHIVFACSTVEIQLTNYVTVVDSKCLQPAGSWMGSFVHKDQQCYVFPFGKKNLPHKVLWNCDCYYPKCMSLREHFTF
ncbi:hypothetical protein NP493_323g06082 [Ridgeia piscesae]|uniref:Uncharacterized protein n=1 Tax=Ridgeia piscesae TaxID=27915 RepID=A0AAD9L657_RIDPI|nr:hypothetical protein NP493_323g06082 [Ridgeia piscesae]